MLGLLLPVALSAMAAALRAGSLAGLRRLRIDWWPLALGSIALHLVLHNPPFNQQVWALDVGPGLWVICLAVMLAVLLRNASLGGPMSTAWRMAAVGIALNMTVVVANGGYMPQSPEARVAARGAALGADGGPTLLHNVVPLNTDARLAWLADVIPQPRWLPKANVVSVGDLILSLGIAWLVFLAIAGRASQEVGRTTDS